MSDPNVAPPKLSLSIPPTLYNQPAAFSDQNTSNTPTGAPHNSGNVLGWQNNAQHGGGNSNSGISSTTSSRGSSTSASASTSSISAAAQERRTTATPNAFTLNSSAPSATKNEPQLRIVDTTHLSSDAPSGVNASPLRRSSQPVALPFGRDAAASRPVAINPDTLGTGASASTSASTSASNSQGGSSAIQFNAPLSYKKPSTLSPQRSSMIATLSQPPPRTDTIPSSRSASPLSSPSPGGQTTRSIPIAELPRRPFSTLLPRDATLSPSSSSHFTHQPPTPMRTSNSAAYNAGVVDTALGSQSLDQAGSKRIAAFDFLNTDSLAPHQHGGKSVLRESPISTTRPSPPMGKGKQRAEVPIMELRILPVTDAVNMFGSTQTSSNYSLSGKIVVRVHNVIREFSPNAHQSGVFMSSSSNGVRDESDNDNKRRNGTMNAAWLPEIATDAVFLDPEEFFASQSYTNDPDSPSTLRVQEIKVMSLSCTFSGYALYVDHSGRFAACRLTEVTEELLPSGYTVKIPELGKSQEYESEFNLSIPGWLPGTNYTRFGGVFYSLEAKAKYTAFDSEQQHAIPSSLVPPRRASMMPESPADSDAEQAHVPLQWQRQQQQQQQYQSDEEATRRTTGTVNSRFAKGRSESAPLSATASPITPSTPSTPRTTWLGKRAKQLSMKTRNQPTKTSSLSTSGSNLDLQSTSSNNGGPAALMHAKPSRLYASRDFIAAFSDPIVIVIRRCREVVPVPVARMAIIGLNGTADGAVLDPPTPIRPATTRTEEFINQSTENTPSSTRLAGPPVAPTTFEVPNDPAKAAAHIASNPGRDADPRRAANMPSSDPSDHAPASSTGPSVPMRHFLHRPMLHPPADAEIPNAENGLPFSLTLSLPSYVAVDGPNSDILNFGVQIEVGRSSTWGRVRELGGLRLRDMELSCIQTERHCSVPSRTFCHAYPLPTEPQAGPYDLPVFGMPSTIAANGRALTNGEVRLRRGYDRAQVQYHMDLMHAGNAPNPSANNVERVRTVIVGPPPTPDKKSKTADGGGRGKERENTRNTPRRPSPGVTSSRQQEIVANDLRQSGSHDISLEEMPNDLPSRRNTTGRGRRAYQSAIRGLSNLATAVMDISFDNEGNTDGGLTEARMQDSRNGNSADGRGEKDGSVDTKRAALYSFAGADGHGVDLTRGRVRMAIKLPLVTSNAVRAKNNSMPQLLPDFESPFTKTRHKLQVKLGFGFGSKPLGGEGEWGQSLVMCVPVRFSESAPREVREQFAPMPIRQVAAGTSQEGSAALNSPLPYSRNGNDNVHDNAVSVHTNSASPASSQIARLSALPGQASERLWFSSTPVLPSYNQLFREDGSRLADEGEDLPQYPGPRAIPSTAGSVTAPSLDARGLDDDNEMVSGASDVPDRVKGFETAVVAGPSSSAAINAAGSERMGERSSSLPGLASPSASAGARRVLSERLHSFDNRIAPSHVLDESIPEGMRGNKASRALQRQEIEEMHRDERQEQARRMRGLSLHSDLPTLGVSGGGGGGEIQVSTDGQGGGAASLGVSATDRENAYSSDEGALRGHEDAHLIGETVDVDEMDAFDDDVPAFAPRSSAQRRDGQEQRTRRVSVGRDSREEMREQMRQQDLSLRSPDMTTDEAPLF